MWLLVALGVGVGVGVGACAKPSGETVPDGQGGDAMTTTGGHGGKGATSSQTASGTGGAEPVRFPYCHTPCTTSNDCAAGTGANDASHWTCDQGNCAYLGCKSDAECEVIQPGSACLAHDGVSVPYCERTCSTPSDCAYPNGNPLFDVDHYQCTNSRCIQLGCNSDAECNWGNPKATYACRAPANGGEKGCNQVCSSPVDCIVSADTPAYDTDNYACEDGVCSYLGCHSDAECQATFTSEPNIVCYQP
jgi:hypothetical protein